MPTPALWAAQLWIVAGCAEVDDLWSDGERWVASVLDNETTASDLPAATTATAARVGSGTGVAQVDGASDARAPAATTDATAATSATAAQGTSSVAPAASAANAANAANSVPWKEVALDRVVRVGREPASKESLGVVLGRLRQLASVGEVRQLPQWLSVRTLDRLAERDRLLVPMAPRTLHLRLAGEPRKLRFDGGRALLELESRGLRRTLTFYLEQDRWRIDLLADAPPIADGHLAPGVPPGGPSSLPSLSEATAGLRGTGPLVAVFETRLGSFRCELAETRAPHSVALFAALARGKVAALVANGDGPRVWKARPFYDGTAFDVRDEGRVLVGAGRQANGSGLRIDDELDIDETFEDRGALVLDHDGPGTASARVQIALTPRPQWRDRYVRIGSCRDLEVLGKLGRAGDTVSLETVEIQRGL